MSKTMGAFASVIEQIVIAIVQPVMSVAVAVIGALTGPIVTVLMSILSAILNALTLPALLLAKSLIEAGILHPFIIVWLVVTKVLWMTLVALLSLLPLLLLRLLETAAMAIIGQARPVYVAVYKTLMATERDPRAYYRNPYYFNAIYDNFPSIAHAVAGNRSIFDLHVINDHVSGLFTVSNPVTDPSFKPGHYSQCVYVGDQVPAYPPYIMLVRQQMKKMYEAMKELHGGLPSVVQVEYDHLKATDDPTPFPEKFSENWGHLKDYFNTLKCMTLDSADIAAHFTGFDIISNAHVLAYNDITSQAIYASQIDPLLDRPIPSLYRTLAKSVLKPPAVGDSVVEKARDTAASASELSAMAVKEVARLVEALSLAVVVCLIVHVLSVKVTVTAGAYDLK